jgi:hypothetical protein
MKDLVGVELFNQYLQLYRQFHSTAEHLFQADLIPKKTDKRWYQMLF